MAVVYISYTYDIYFVYLISCCFEPAGAWVMKTSLDKFLHCACYSTLTSAFLIFSPAIARNCMATEGSKRVKIYALPAGTYIGANPPWFAF